MKYFYPIFIFLTVSLSSFSQENNNAPSQTLTALSSQEKADLKALPKLQLPEKYRNRSLPAVVDNSTQPYMRSAFQQTGLCCGQAAGIAYNYTYEIDRARDLTADINDNLYPTHFTWNWEHGGNGWYGASYLHSFQVLKHCGNVNVTDYGGSLAYGGSARWMSGYENYYQGMSNRINSVYQIQVGTPEGLEIFKNWMYDHLDESSVGGVGSFYSQYMAVSNTLPAGTPEAGKYVLTYFSGNANHAQTIVGYNDSIRWDYNSDGQYTNDIDINGDGVVNMKDWEIGGFKMVQSYGGVPGWGDQGFAYMMYKTVADNLGQGGIWNHCVHVLDVKENCNPQATIKVTMTHNARNKIKVVAGLSNDVSATTPQYILEYPIFNYQSGEQYMQGGTSAPENKTIEFGLDISPLMGEIELNQNIKFFLQVYENDPDGSGVGQIDNFSVINYTSGTANEIICSQSNVPINNNDLTQLSVVANINFNRVHITNPALPPATVGQPYSHQLVAFGGTPPYNFSLLKLYEEEASTETFPMIDQYQLNPSNNSSGKVTQALAFDFPYYDSTYSSVTLYVDGYLMFDEQLYPYPYFHQDLNLFRISRHISPFMCKAIQLYSSSGNGIWYEGDTSHACFRWKASIADLSGTTEINVAVKLFPNGQIEMYYGDIVIPDGIAWIPGLCDGNDEDLQYSSFYFEGLPPANTKYTYTPYYCPDGISVSDNGLISGMVQQPVNGELLSFKVTDNNFVYDRTSLIFATSGIMISDSVSAGGNEIIDYGEIVNLSVNLTNLESNPISDASISIEIDDPYVNIMDGNQYIGNLAVGQSIELVNAFTFQVAPDVPDQHPINIETSITGIRQTWENSLLHFAHAPLVEILETIVDDGNNGLLDPGETCDLLVNIQNNGGSKASSVNCLLDTQSPYITINQNSAFLPVIMPDSSKVLQYNITLDAGAPIGYQLPFELELSGSMSYHTILPFELRVGLTIEDFETGDFSLFSWGFKGDKPWKISQQYPFEGAFSAKSGSITHKEFSSMILDIDVLEAGNISFFRKVSCEDAANHNYDFLTFYIDDVEQSRWDSILNWEEVSFPVASGYHRFEWRYSKDSTVTEGLDAAFIDYISLPSCLDAYPHLISIPEELDKTMHPEIQDTDTLIISNAGDGEMEFEILISSITKNMPDGGRNISGSFLECDQTEFLAGEPFTWSFAVFNNSDDNEWIKELSIQIPDGITIESATNFTGGSGGDMLFTGSFGNGPLLTWFGEDASGWGVVHPNEFAYGEISGYVDAAFSSDALLDYVIYGEVYGAEPHIVEGEITLNNLGSLVPWISLDHYDGSVQGQSNHDLLVTFNTAGLSDGHYYCNILMSDNFQNETIIPVHLLVDTYLETDEYQEKAAGLEVYPNPFSNDINIVYTNGSSERINIKIVDALGNTQMVIAEQLAVKAGKHSYRRNASDLNNGIYFIILESEEQRMVEKVIKLNSKM